MINFNFMLIIFLLNMSQIVYSNNKTSIGSLPATSNQPRLIGGRLTLDTATNTIMTNIILLLAKDQRLLHRISDLDKKKWHEIINQVAKLFEKSQFENDYQRVAKLSFDLIDLTQDVYDNEIKTAAVNKDKLARNIFAENIEAIIFDYLKNNPKAINWKPIINDINLSKIRENSLKLRLLPKLNKIEENLNEIKKANLSISNKLRNILSNSDEKKRREVLLEFTERILKLVNSVRNSRTDLIKLKREYEKAIRQTK